MFVQITIVQSPRWMNTARWEGEWFQQRRPWEGLKQGQGRPVGAENKLKEGHSPICSFVDP